MILRIAKYNRIIASALCMAFCLYTSPAVIYASEINQTGVPFTTATTINQNNNIFNISTNTTNAAGNIGINTFGRFNVSQGDIVNLNLINAQNKLVNLIFDSSASQIDGIVNSYMNGQIGGNVLFANPNGFVVGSTGVFNVGSLTLITPTESFMKSLFSGDKTNPDIVNENLDSLITFNMNGSDYLLLGGGKDTKIKLMPAPITINGKINSGGGIDLLNGGQEINIGNGAELNANMNFSVSEGVVTATPKENVTPTPVEKTYDEAGKLVNQKYKLAMDGGNGIVIASQNTAQNRDYLSSIVNIDGKVNANGANVFAQTEIYNIDKAENVSTSLINVKSNGDIQGYDVALNAIAQAKDLDSDVLGAIESDTWLNYLRPEEWIDAVIDDFVHLGSLKTKVTVESGAKITAADDISINSISLLDFSPLLPYTAPTFAFGYWDFDSETETKVKSGASLTAGKNLDVKALTDFHMFNEIKSSSLIEVVDVKHKLGRLGSYTLNLSLINTINKAVIENGANLNVAKDINVIASMLRDYSNQTKNGLIPVVDRNRGSAGVAIGIYSLSSDNEAIMNADANINGGLTVLADYIGKIDSSVQAASYAAGEDGDFGAVGRIVNSLLGGIQKLTPVFETLKTSRAARADAIFNNIATTGALNVSVDNVKNYAYIGDSDKGIKPVIKAGNITVGATLTDNKSMTYAETESDNAKDSAAGSIAVNVKNLDADAKVYGDLTLSGSDISQALIIRSKTDVQHPQGYLDWVKETLHGLGILNDIDKTHADITKVDSSNVDEFLAQYGLSRDFQTDVDNAGEKLAIFNVIDFNTLGAHGFFNTFATSQANAKTNEGKTNAWAGAIATAVFNTKSNAELAGGSSINLTGNDADKNNILIQSDTISEMWSGAALMSSFNYDKLFAGMTARDGDSAGGSISVQVGVIDTIAKIGENVLVQTTGNGVTGNIDVLAKENGEYVNVGNGTSAADKAGKGGDIAVTVLAGGKTKAYIDRNADINAKNISVNATKDDVLVHGLIAYVNSENTKSFGISTIGIGDTVEAYIKGNINAAQDVLVNAEYDKILVNAIINAGVAKNGAPIEQERMLEPQDVDSSVSSLDDFMSEDSIELDAMSDILPDDGILGNLNLANNQYVNPNRRTTAYAGNILLNVSNSTVKSYIDDNAKVLAGNDVKVDAKSSDKNVQVAGILAVNGKSGGGASVTFDLSKNNVQAYIGSAVVDASHDISVGAGENNLLVAVSAGIGQAKDSSGVGVVSLDIQKNNIEAAIKDGAKINTNVDNATQSVSVNADLKNKLVKAVGALTIQSGGGEGSGAKGAAIDGDVAINSVKAYIQGADVNASDKLNVSASQKTNLVDVSMSGAVSAQNRAYDGTVAVYTSSGETSAYIKDTKINKTAGRTNKGASTTVSADNTYDNVTITGTVTGASSNAVGGSFRIDWIADKINSYIAKSDIDATGALNMTNNSTLDSVAITVAGQGSKDENAYGGAIMLAVDSTVQNNYIDDSDINTGSLTFDSDSVFKTVGVTGAVTVATSGKAIGGSVYFAVAANDINTFVTNSDVVSANDVNMTSDYTIDNVSVIFAGSGGRGAAASGSVDTVINNSNSNTYIANKNDNEKSHNSTNVTANNGKITLKGNNDVSINTINGSIAVSLSSNAIGAAINTVVDNNDLQAYVESATVTAKNDVDISATSDESVMSISIGGAGGDGLTAAGSVNTMVMSSDINSFINDSVVTSQTENVKVTASGDSTITGGTGAASISVGSMAFGLSLVTGVINNSIQAYIENSKVDASKDVSLSATANESIGTKTKPFITVAGGYSEEVTGEGVLDTMVINSTAKTEIKGTKTIGNDKKGITAGNDVILSSSGTDTLYAVGGSVGASAEIGVGATINTIVVDKDTLSNVENTKISAKNINAKSTETDNFFTTVVAASGAGTGALSGVINTNVITSDVKSTIKNSTINATNDIDIDSKATANMQTITGAVSGAGTAGIGLSAVNDVIRYRLESSADNVVATFDKLNIDAQTDNTYKFSTVSGAGGGTAGVTGVENINYINNSVKAFATGDLTGNKADITAKDKVTFTDSYSGTVGGGGTAGVGATVEVNEVTSTVLAYIGGSKVKINDIDIKANGEQNFDGIFAAGFAGSGFVSGAGTVLVNTVETTVKAYVTDNTKIALINGENESAINTLKLTAQNDMTLTEHTGALAVGLSGGGIGATVVVNNIKNTVEAYTGKNANIYANTINIDATSNNNLGKSNDPLLAVSGAGGLYAGIAGTVLYTSVEDSVSAYTGENNSIKLSDNGKLDINAEDITKVYTGIGGVGLGAVGVGASVGYTVVENTVLAFVGAGTGITGDSANISITANSNEYANSKAIVVSGGVGALSGGVLYNSFGKQVGNASYNELSDKDKENFNAANSQRNEALSKANEKTAGADNSYKNSYNALLDRVKENKNTKGSKVRDIAKKTSEDSLYTKAEGSGSSLPTTERTKTTSAFVDTSASIKANTLKINAQNTDDVTFNLLGDAFGFIGVGISAAISDVQTTTNAFIQNNANIDVNSFSLKADSNDTQKLEANATTGGVTSGSGSITYAVSNKTTNAYVNQNTVIKSLNDLLINTASVSDLTSNSNGFSGGGVVVGVSSAKSKSQGSSRIDIGEGVGLTSTNGKIEITTNTTDTSNTDAQAATGSLVGGTGGEAFSTTGKDSTINIGANFSASAAGDLNITSTSKNTSKSNSNGRAYGGISAGGTKTSSDINQTSGVKIADATSEKNISAAKVNISSSADNNAKADTYAGIGAAAGIAGSGVYTNITSNNNVSVGKNYNVTTGKYDVSADTNNVYKSYNKSDAKGIIAVAIPFIENTVNSTVSAVSDSNINSQTSVTVKAANEIQKAAVDGYDLYGGSGGLGDGAGGHIHDYITMTTSADFGGNYAKANGKFGEGSIDISAYNIANINEKADLYSLGGISGADMDSMVDLSATATTTISNGGIETINDHINYVARNDIDVYTKSNSESYGGVAGAGGNSSAIVNSVISEVIFNDTVKSTSGRDTNISAISNKNVEAYMYARTRGAFSILNDQANAKSNNSVAKITIKGNGLDDETSGNAVITAYDSINIIAKNTSDKIKATRDSKAYQIWCIPVTGTGREYTNNAKSGEIVVNGILKSGKGFNKSLIIDMDGTLHKNGIDAEETQTGSISSADIDVDIDLYKQSEARATAEYNDCTQVEQNSIKSYKTVITNQKNEIATRNAAITTNNNSIDTYYDEFKTQYSGEDIVLPYINAARAYWADVTNTEKATAYQNAKDTMDGQAGSLPDDIKAIISNIKAKADVITQDCEKIIQCNNAIASAQANIDTIEASIKDITDKYLAQIAVLEAKIHELEEKKEAGSEFPVFSIVVDDVIIRNGEINFYGDGKTGVNGNGWIKTPGNNASITILNNSVSNLVFNKLSINGDLKGGVNFIDSVKGADLHFKTEADKPSIISITNTVDKNDPTVQIDSDSHAGDIVLRGITENPYGAVEITNYTGNVMSEGGITAKDLHIRVPNGGYEQQYQPKEQKIGGSGGTGAVVASGDIIIAAKTIDINGLIKSGTEIKEVTIPDFTVIKKDDGKYYQSVGGLETEMTESTVTAGYYYLTLTNDTSDLASLRQIKAYFRPSDATATGTNIAGDIYLFKADTSGGNITLTGNIVNSSGTGGKIELLNGYGHINVVNNSNHNLITSALNADTKTKGLLTINDFKMSSATDTTFDNITQADLTTAFLNEHAGKYTATIIDENSNNLNIKTTAENITAGNGYWSGTTSKSTTADGATMYSTSYIPGEDAYVITSAGKSGSYQRYVKRSWWTEFWYGKKYETVYFHQDPTYDVKQNAVAVNFVGFDSPQINITSNGTGDIAMNSNISAITGDINIQSAGNILTNSVNYAISGKNITLTAGGAGNLKNIGENVGGIAIRPVQVVVYDNGLLTAKGNDVYLNYPKTDISNIVLNANNYAYLATDDGTMDMQGKTKVGLNAKELDLRADKININPSDIAEGGDYNINVSNWRARAKDDIYIDNRGDITAKYIVSENNKNITLISRLGGIKAGDTDAYSDYNIIGGNVNLISNEKNIGSADKPLRIANNGIYYVLAKDDIYIDSGAKIYVDDIVSKNGSVNLNAKFGIISSEITTDINGKAVVYNADGSITYQDGTPVAHNDIRLYNIFSDGNINLKTETGNIENIFADTNGVINASAGYTGDSIADATSDVHITLMSKSPTDEELNKLKNNEISFEDFISGYKDMTLGVIKATQNITLSSEKGVKNADANSYIQGGSITINAIGDVGSDASKIELVPSKEVAVYTRAGNNVYLDNKNELKINKIDVTGGDTSSEYAKNQSNSLDNVVINSESNITNAARTQNVEEAYVYYDKDGNVVDTPTEGGTTITVHQLKTETQTVPNVRAENISLSSGGNIGDYSNELIVNTTSEDNNKGLIYNALQKAYIKGINGTLNIISGNSSGDVEIVSTDTTVIANNITTGGNVKINAQTDVFATNIIADNAAHNSSIQILGKDVVLNNAIAKQIILNDNNTVITGNITTDKLTDTSLNGTVINSANINPLAAPSDYILTADSSGNISVKNSVINGNTSLVTNNNGEIYIEGSKIIGDTENTTLSADSSGNISVKNSVINGNTSLVTNNNGEIYIEGSNFIGDTENTTLSADSSGNVLVKNSVINGNTSLTANNQNLYIENTKITGNTNLKAKGNTEITTLTVNGEMNNQSANMNVTDRLDVTGNANISTANNVRIANGHINNNLNVDAQNIKVDEIQLDGNINAAANTVNINTSYNFNIGNIQGKDNLYTQDIIINSADSMINGKTGDDINLYAKNINLIAGNSIGTNGNKININLPDNNSIAVVAGNDMNIRTIGGSANYTKIISKNANIDSDNIVAIRNMNVDNLELKTMSTDINIIGNVNKKADINTIDKTIAINNVDFVPSYSATSQLHTGILPFYLVTDSNKNIIVDSKFVVRHDQNILINGTDVESSMESEAIKAGETNQKNSERKTNIIESNKVIYEIRNLSDESVIIRTINGEIATPENINEIINFGNKISENK